MACAMNGRIGVIGSPGLVKAALDAHACHNGISTTAGYRTARDALAGDRLATLYLSTAFMKAALPTGTFPAELGTAFPTTDYQAALAAIPEWMMAGVSAEDDALVADVVTAPVTAPAPSAGASPVATLPPAHLSRTASLLPANTLALVDIHGAGIAIRNALAQVRANPSLVPSLTQLDTTLAALGGPDALVGWIEDGGIAVLPDAKGVTGGLLLLAPDDATAAAKVAQLKSLVSLAGLGVSQVQVHDETVSGSPMTIVDLGDVSTLIPGGATSGLPIPAGTHVTLAFAAKGSAVIAGGDAFVRATLGVSAGGSLADATPYKHALAHATAENLGELYLGTGSILDLADTLIPEAQRASFDADTKPYLAPFDALLETTTLEHGGAHLRLVATVK